MLGFLRHLPVVPESFIMADMGSSYWLFPTANAMATQTMAKEMTPISIHPSRMTADFLEVVVACWCNGTSAWSPGTTLRVVPSSHFSTFTENEGLNY
jgi:hypothetical protein